MRCLPLQHPTLPCSRTHEHHLPHLHPPARDGRGLHHLDRALVCGCSLADEPQWRFVLLVVTFVRF